jgi:hypothetical protein
VQLAGPAAGRSSRHGPGVTMKQGLRTWWGGALVALGAGACALQSSGTRAIEGPEIGGVGGGPAGGGQMSERGVGGVAAAGAPSAGAPGGGAPGGGGGPGPAGGAGGGGAGGGDGAAGSGGDALACGATSSAGALIVCDGARECDSANPPECPDGAAFCRIECSGALGCREAVIDCRKAVDCQVVCSGAGACQDATVRCGTGSCDVLCGDAGGDDVAACDAGFELDCKESSRACTICGARAGADVTVRDDDKCREAGCACGVVGACPLRGARGAGGPSDVVRRRARRRRFVRRRKASRGAGATRGGGGGGGGRAHSWRM